MRTRRDTSGHTPASPAFGVAERAPSSGSSTARTSRRGSGPDGEVLAALDARDAEIGRLEAEVDRLRALAFQVGSAGIRAAEEVDALRAELRREREGHAGTVRELEAWKRLATELEGGRRAA